MFRIFQRTEEIYRHGPWKGLEAILAERPLWPDGLALVAAVEQDSEREVRLRDFPT